MFKHSASLPWGLLSLSCPILQIVPGNPRRRPPCLHKSPCLPKTCSPAPPKKKKHQRGSARPKTYNKRPLEKINNKGVLMLLARDFGLLVGHVDWQFCLAAVLRVVLFCWFLPVAVLSVSVIPVKQRVMLTSFHYSSRKSTVFP